MERIRGDLMNPRTQREALSAFVHRCTGEHIPAWARRGSGSGPYHVQFRDDKEWLANTYFYVTNTGRLSRAHRFCESTPTWNGPLIT